MFNNVPICSTLLLNIFHTNNLTVFNILIQNGLFHNNMTDFSCHSIQSFYDNSAAFTFFDSQRCHVMKC